MSSRRKPSPHTPHPTPHTPHPALSQLFRESTREKPDFFFTS
ncbi:hypothetical protein [Microcystis aeruginosa]|nr:hypothetical protein [Microcystis aeruginosa]